ncbi:hypothetical protein [Flexivirga meconopsidis]|uniref:hypothetical protein n=1 Tax=Flexivirga meconopsidis TaxID=2977121 RepID=UPI00223F463C|nr:hypothetical protein [Flexivirga meconopsidis]
MTTSFKGKAIRTDADLLARWRELMGEGGFGRRCLWLIFLNARGRQADLVMPVDEIPMRPDPQEIAGIARFIAMMRDQVGVAEVPLLLSRPGPSEITENDRRWAIALTDALCDQQPRWPIHLATKNRVQVFAPDDLIALDPGA